MSHALVKVELPGPHWPAQRHHALFMHIAWQRFAHVCIRGRVAGSRCCGSILGVTMAGTAATDAGRARTEGVLIIGIVAQHPPVNGVAKLRCMWRMCWGGRWVLLWVGGGMTKRIPQHGPCPTSTQSHTLLYMVMAATLDTRTNRSTK